MTNTQTDAAAAEIKKAIRAIQNDYVWIINYPYIKVENPKYQEDNGENPYLVIHVQSAIAQPLPEPVAWQVKDYADGWVSFSHKKQAENYAELNGAIIRPLYATPKPSPPAQTAWAVKGPDKLIMLDTIARTKELVEDRCPERKDFTVVPVTVREASA